MRTRAFLFSGIILFFLSGCNRSQQEESLAKQADLGFQAAANEAPVVAKAENMPGARTFSQESNPAVQEYAEPVPERKIIRDGDISIETKDIRKKKNQVDTLIRSFKAYLASEAFYDNVASLDYNLTVRIPAENYDFFISALEKGPDRILNKNIRARDVTEEYYDVTTRLNSKKEVEKRYLQILAKASSVKDILEIEEKLGQIREEIESTEGRLRLLENQVSYSTLNIYITQPKEQKYIPEERQGFLQQLIKTLHKGWLGLLGFVLLFLRLWPLWLVGIILWRLIVFFRKRRNKRSAG